MADTYSTKKINELDIVNSADDSDIMMVGKTSTGTTSAITKSNFLKEVTTTLNSHASEIVTNAENITANADEIKTNTNNIAQNTSNINTNAENIAKNTDDISELNSALSDLDSKLDVGDRVNITGWYGGGLTTTNTSVRFSIPFFKGYGTVTSLTIGAISIRQNGSYLVSDQTASAAGIEVSFSQRDTFLDVTFAKSSGYGGTNNDSVAIQLSSAYAEIG